MLVKKIIIVKSGCTVEPEKKSQFRIKFENYRQRCNFQIIKTKKIKLLGRVVKRGKSKTTAELPDNKKEKTQEEVIKKGIWFKPKKIFFTLQP